MPLAKLLVSEPDSPGEVGCVAEAISLSTDKGSISRRSGSGVL